MSGRVRRLPADGRGAVSSRSPAAAATPSLEPMGTTDDMTPEEKRHDQLTSAPGATEDDARPRIEVSEHDGVKRIDIADDAPVRPGDPTEDPEA
ncbi:hypothetical protein GCM10027426_04490 [Microbacterium lacusdiani]